MVYDYSKGEEFIAYDTASGNVSKTRQIVMLYDGMISFVNRAKTAIEEKDFQENFNLLNRAGLIAQSLQASIDHKNGGEISKILDDFYTITFVRMMRLNSEPLEEYDRVTDDIKKMRDAWEHVDTENSAKNGASDGSDLPDAPPSPTGDTDEAPIDQVIEQTGPSGLSLSV